MKPALPPAGSTCPSQPPVRSKPACSGRVVVTISLQRYSARISHVHFAPLRSRSAIGRFQFSVMVGSVNATTVVLRGARPRRSSTGARCMSTTPFPDGESYQQVVDRVSGWLDDVMQQFDTCTVLVIGHRATFYALEHLLRPVTLHRSGDVDLEMAARVDLYRGSSATGVSDHFPSSLIRAS